MKKSIKLNEFFFERIDISLPTFPGIKGKFLIPKIGGEAAIYMHKKRKNIVAFRWTLDITSKKIKGQPALKIFVAIVGIFESSHNTDKEKYKEALKNAPSILYEIVKIHLEKIIANSMVKMKTLPHINFKKIKIWTES
jgi:preprotein translocase subunit SecB